jgi:CRP-like cAMP-binding protein
MPEYNPSVLRRMLTLRQLPMLAKIDLDELATVAENLVEVRFPAGTPIGTAGSRLPAIQIVVDGKIEIVHGAEILGPRQIYGALEVLAGRPATRSAIAVTATRTLQMSAFELGEVLEDNFGVLLATLRALAGRLLREPPGPPRVSGAIVPVDGLGLVERLVVFRQQVPFAAARLQALATLAQTAEELVWDAGDIVARAGEPATRALVIIEGSLRLRDTHGATRMLGAGDPIGYLENLAGVDHGGTIEATTPVRALGNTGTQLLDVLEDHTDLGLAMISTFAGTLLDGGNRRARHVVN